MTSARKSLLAAPVAVAMIATMAAPAHASADDQSRLDAVVEAFNQRMTDAGWESQGVPERAPTDSLPDAEMDDTMLGGDEAFAECLGDLAAIFEGRPTEELLGQTAEAFSDEFVFVAESEAAEQTEAPAGTGDLDFDFDFDLDFQEETVSAQALSVDEAEVGTLEEFIDAFGSEETGDCLSDALAAELAAGEEELEDFPLMSGFEVDIATEGDLGVGDQSAAMSLTMSMNMFGLPLEINASFLMARIGRDLVGVSHAVIGEPQTDFDALAELQVLADSL